jgi:carbon monoxide dehydrogenase subunit G
VQSVETVEDGFLEIDAADTVEVVTERAWTLLTDFERLADYMPNVDSSYVHSVTDSS